MQFTKTISFFISFLALKAFAISLVPGPEWTASNPGFQYSKQILVDHLNATHYPGFLMASGLKRIVLHPGPLLQGNNLVGGYASDDTIDVVAITDVHLVDCSRYHEGETDFLNCQMASGLSAHNVTSFLLKFNHELFHVIDRNLLTDRTPNDPINVQWRQLNPPGFAYLAHALDAPTRTSSMDAFGNLRIYSPQFITEYSSHTIDEDKAETFALALLKSDEFFRVIAPANPVLAAKYRLIREMLDRITHNNAAIIPLPLQGHDE